VTPVTPTVTRHAPHAPRHATPCLSGTQRVTQGHAPYGVTLPLRERGKRDTPAPQIVAPHPPPRPPGLVGESSVSVSDAARVRDEEPAE